jgi:hypothetical protein
MRLLKDKSKKTTGIILLMIVIVVIAYNYSNFESQLNLHLSTWVSENFYEKILKVKEETKNIGGPIIFIAFSHEASTLSYYRNIIEMEIGNAYLYFGKLEFLMEREATPAPLFKSDDDVNYSTYYFADIEKVLKMTQPFTIIIVSELYKLDNLSASTLKEYLNDDGIYLIPINESNQTLQLNQTITAYTDYISSSQGFYSYKADWAYAGSILEYYTELGEPTISARVTYPLWLPNSKNSSNLYVHLFDAFYPDWGTVSFLFDNNYVGNYTYRGTGAPTWYNMTLGSYNGGFHSLAIALNSSFHGILRLDVIVLDNR